LIVRKVSQLSGRWVFRHKVDENGNPIRRKARWVARGFLQTEGIDYTETAAPTLSKQGLRLLLAVAFSKKIFLKQADIKCAFIQGDIDHTVYVEEPHGFEIGENKVCLLKKALYGLKQSPLLWNRKLDKVLTAAGYIKCNNESCLYKLMKGDLLIIIGIYVDDLVIAATSESAIDSAIKTLSNHFDVVDLGYPKFLLGMQLEILPNYAILHQDTYLKQFIQAMSMQSARQVGTPISHLPESSITKLQQLSASQSNSAYQSAVGSLLYAAVCT
jgi:Reverse transcriptase (RNA-dependent DNA polymerase)